MLRDTVLFGARIVSCASVLLSLSHEGRGQHAAELSDDVPGHQGSAETVLGHFPQAPTDEDYYRPQPEKVVLGQLLFFDKILSGNMNISCASCHHPFAGAGDGLSLPIGEGADGLGVTRNTGIGSAAVPERVPRNSPHLFNVGAKEFTRMFHDGRVELDSGQPSGFLTPAGDDLPMGLDNVLAAQAMFPVTSGTEMAGQLGENEVANAAAAGDLLLVWDLLAQRLRSNPIYEELFAAIYPDIHDGRDITYVHAANAIAAWEAATFRADNSPFDRYLRHEPAALSANERRGMRIFYGLADCASCHSGPFQTNHEFYAIGMPQIGPGKGDNLPGYNDGVDDFGRERVSGDPSDRFRFRVPSLRNVALTGPWGHDGAYNSLESIVRHHLDTFGALAVYDPADHVVLPSRLDLDAIDFICFSDPVRRQAIMDRVEIPAVDLTDEQIGWLIDFLHALTDRNSVDLRMTVPKEVPSGLPLYE